jgi:hypothetical protein
VTLLTDPGVTGRRPTSIEPEELVPSEGAAALIRVKPETLANWRSKGRGPRYVKIGRACFYIRGDLAAWLAAQVVDPAE